MKKNLIIALILIVKVCSAQSSPPWNQFDTPHGYIQLGPMTTEWGHIYTDRDNFLFNKPIYISGGSLSSYFGSDLSLKTGGITRLKISDSQGFIGIGTTNPSAMLEVIGDDESVMKLTHEASSDWQTAVRIGTDRDKTKAFVIENSTTGVQDFIVWGNGIVNAKKIYASELHITLSAIGIYWPDYVFNLDYELTDLNFLESYIKREKHLPNVPSAKEISEGGLNIGEMNSVLLRKIEELTLYIIDQNKRIETLENQ